MDEVQREIRELAREILTGRLAPVEGARRIAAKATSGDDSELAVFAKLARDGNEEAILEQASLLVADTA